MSEIRPPHVPLPDDPAFWSADALADILGTNAKAVRWHLQRLKKRNLSEPFPDSQRPFPLERRHAQRLADYIMMRPKNKGPKPGKAKRTRRKVSAKLASNEL